MNYAQLHIWSSSCKFLLACVYFPKIGCSCKFLLACVYFTKIGCSGKFPLACVYFPKIGCSGKFLLACVYFPQIGCYNIGTYFCTAEIWCKDQKQFRATCLFGWIFKDQNEDALCFPDYWIFRGEIFCIIFLLNLAIKVHPTVKMYQTKSRHALF